MSGKEKTVENTLLLEKKEIYVGGEKFTIGPLVRAQYQKLINIMVTLALKIDKDKLDNLEDNTAYLINLISDDLLLNIYEISLKKERKWINENMTMNQELELFKTILEVNDFEKLIKNFTNLIQGKALSVIRERYQSLK